MTGNEIRQKFLDFYRERDHALVPPAPLVLTGDTTTLFTSSGMQPLISYLLGSPHPLGRRLANSQPCFRAEDILEVGDNRHTTFFEMLGNWSLGDYFKQEQLSWVWQFLTQELQLPPEKLYVTVFQGNVDIPKDETSIEIWKKLGLSDDHILEYGVEKNWWSRSGTPDVMPTGEPGGITSEIFFEFTQVDHRPRYGPVCHPNCDCGRFIEIGNNVFMQYQKQPDGSLKELSQKNVDFGGGLERLLASVNNTPDIFQTDLLQPLIEKIQTLTAKPYSSNQAPMQVIADHLKATAFIIDSGIEPGNKLQGYVLRRLLRRAAVKFYQLTGHSAAGSEFETIAQEAVRLYPDYLQPPINLALISQEMDRFARTLDKGIKLLDSVSPFDLYQTYGFPIEITQELYHQKGKSLDRAAFDQELKKHQELSRTATRGLFKGGVIDAGDLTTKYHTATHLFHQALRQVLGPHVRQTGSNITAERLRFDFSHPQALTNEQTRQVEDLVNQQIAADLPVSREEMTLEEAKKTGALAFFEGKYADRITVYSIGSFSKEVCGGPHVDHTGQINRLSIYKQEAVGGGSRRLYAKLETNGEDYQSV